MKEGQGSRATSAAWDRIWIGHSYRLAQIRTARAKIKVAAAIGMGMKFAPDERILDLACGSGDNLIETAVQMAGEARLFAIDISETALRLARRNFEASALAVQPIRADWHCLPLRSGSIDKVMAMMAPFRAVVDEIARVLAPGGKLFMVAPSSDSLTSAFYRVKESILRGPFDDTRNYSPRDLIELLGTSLKVEELQILHSGPDRPWSSKLDRTIARWAPEWGRYIVARCARSIPP